MKLIPLLLLTLLSFQSYAGELTNDDCGRKTLHYGELFELTVKHSHPTNDVFTFKYCKSGGKENNFFVVKQFSSETEPKKIIFKLTPDQSETVIGKYEKALESNLKDNTDGSDGSHWCLDSVNVHTEISICFWDPSSDYEERGLTGMYDLGDYLWDLTGIQGEI